MFEQAVLPIQDEARFAALKASMERTFAPDGVDGYLRRLEKVKLRAREFERILERGLLGADTASMYRVLGDSDRGQVRELYLRLVEQVAPQLRAKYLKVYAYY